MVFHNGIVLNDKELFLKEKLLRNNNIDTEIIAALAEKYLDKNNIENTIKPILSKCEGMISSAICFTELGKLVLFTNNGSLYYAEKKGRILSLTESSLDLNFRDNPNFFRFHQVVYIIFAISTFVIIVSQLTEG